VTGDIREWLAKNRLRTALDRLGTAADGNEKGRLLEQVLSAVFAAHAGFAVLEMRYSTGDEEIDLIVKNDVMTSFWIALSSPLLFIECKNWTMSVGAKELRDFESKMRNHTPLTRVGFFVAANGFTRGFTDELKRLSRDAFTVVPIDLEALYEFIEGGSSISDWLASMIGKIY
jgi:hypothetical protein